jgi:murein DD-endopeptidase MepM/ murein hydrolase activator NlpD
MQMNTHTFTPCNARHTGLRNAVLTAGLLLSLSHASWTHAAPTPIIQPAANYGHYCSLKYAGGGWAFGSLAGSTSTPCENMLKSSPGGTVARAGLWDTVGQNNVLLRCDGALLIYRAAGSVPLNMAYKAASGKKNCTFVVAPTRLAIFGAPYGKTSVLQPSVHSDVNNASYNVFNYNVYNIKMDRTKFGQPVDPLDVNGSWVDRFGKFRKGMHEPAYDWIMPGGKPLVALAAGRIVESRARDVTQFKCYSNKQNEIYIEHQIGSGLYAEKFISYYAHLSKRLVVKEQIVASGQQIGNVGNTGCTGGLNHLHMSVLRTTNLSGYRNIDFAVTPGGYGVNTIEGVIDPYGWAAPQGIDPWAWMYQGKTMWDQYLQKNIKDPGAFSMNLWKPGSAPPVPAQ